MNIIKNRIIVQPVFFIILLGFAVRIFFWLVAADFLLGHSIYISGDTTGWTDSFLNLLKHGCYTFDLNNKEAYFGRVPGYSFFWGVHYLLVGSNYVYQAVAFSQIVLDCVAVYLVYRISNFVFEYKLAAILSALLYAVYPFVIIWVTVSYSEVLSNFINILCVFLVLRPEKKTIDYLIIGFLLALLFLTREFVAASLVFILLYILLDTQASLKKRLNYSSLLAIGFICLYALWPIRNYVNHDRFLLTRSNKGFSFYQEDYSSFRSWVVCWDNDEVVWLEKAVRNSYKVDFPAMAFPSKEDERLASKALAACGVCGTSFDHWDRVFEVKNQKRDTSLNCNTEIANDFTALRISYIQNKPLEYFTKVPFMNLKKAFFKNGAKNIESSLIQTLLFGYRSVLVVLGFIGLVLCFRNKKLIPIGGYVVFIYVFFSFVIRYIEMRNLLQGDTLLLIPAGWVIARMLDYVFSNSHKKIEV